MRADPPAEAGQRIEQSRGVVRSVGRYSMIVYSDLDPAEVDRAIAEQVDYVRASGEDLEWKLYAHDRPATLAAALAAHSFEPDERETLMVCDLRAKDGRTDDDACGDATSVRVRPVTNEDDLRTYAEISGRSFDREAETLALSLAPVLFAPDPDTFAYVAYVGERPAAAGRLHLTPDRSFASIWAGGTDPALRKRGAYRALVAERARVARERGYRYLTVDARETSRPILERLGFVAIVTVRAWNLKARP